MTEAESEPIAPLRVRETRTEATGFGGNLTQDERVRDLEPGEAPPEGAEIVTAGKHNWRPVVEK